MANASTRRGPIPARGPIVDDEFFLTVSGFNLATSITHITSISAVKYWEVLAGTQLNRFQNIKMSASLKHIELFNDITEYVWCIRFIGFRAYRNVALITNASFFILTIA